MKLAAAVIATTTLAAAVDAGRFSSSSSSRRRHLQDYELVAGYEPATAGMPDYCAVDKDLYVIQEQLAYQTDEGIEAARKVYEEGGNSKSYAEVTLGSATTADIAEGDAIAGVDDAGSAVTGTAYADYPTGTTTLWVLYDVPEIQADNVKCKVGALPTPILDGCLAAEGSLTVGDVEYTYTYDPTTDNNSGRSFDDWSLSADTKMLEGCQGCPYKDFSYFYDYYGTHDYAHQFTVAAFNKTSTTFTNGNHDFSSITSVGQEEFIRKAIAFINVFMYVIREFEDGIDQCELGNIEDGNHGWDEGVCFFAGSLEGTDGSGTEGVMIHRLIDKRCAEWKTCGESGDEIEGQAKLNDDLLVLFDQGKAELSSGDCEAASATLEQITPKLYIPLIQGAISYAYEIAFFEEAGEKERAEGAAFAAAVLPRIHAADADAATTIYDNLNFNAGSMDFAAVKSAFESVYEDLGITCADVGGFFNATAEAYYEGAEPCGTSTDAETTETTATTTAADGEAAPVEDAPADAPADTPAEAPADAPAEAPADAPAEAPASPASAALAFVAHAVVATAAAVAVM